MPARPRVIFFGTTNELSLAAFETLLTGAVIVKALFVSRNAVGGRQLTEPVERLIPDALAGELPLVNPFFKPNILHAAWSAGVPIFALDNITNAPFIDLITELRPDAACVACFPWKLPLDLISRAPMGFLNVHPSLLPHYRGPAPLFWLFRRDDRQRRGVSVHLMDAGLDTGPLLCQQPQTFPDGLGQAAIEHTCGELGGHLLLEALSMLSSGAQARPQTVAGSYHPWPQATDYALDTNWAARRAFNFMRATNGEAVAYPLPDRDPILRLVEALDFRPHDRQQEPVIISSQTARIQFSPGILIASVSLLP